MHSLFACGCTCLHSFVGGLLLLACGLSRLGVSLGHICQVCIDIVSTLGTFCLLVDAYVCNVKVGGLLLLVGGLSKLAFSFVYI